MKKRPLRKSGRVDPVALPASEWPADDLRGQRKVDRNGNISFAGIVYNVGRGWAGRMVDAFTQDGRFYVVAGEVVVRTHPARHAPEKEPLAVLDRRRGLVAASNG